MPAFLSNPLWPLGTTEKLLKDYRPTDNTLWTDHFSFSVRVFDSGIVCCVLMWVVAGQPEFTGSHRVHRLTFDLDPQITPQPPKPPGHFF